MLFWPDFHINPDYNDIPILSRFFIKNFCKVMKFNGILNNKKTSKMTFLWIKNDIFFQSDETFFYQKIFLSQDLQATIKAIFEKYVLTFYLKLNINCIKSIY